jgi:hypothetical protein
MRYNVLVIRAILGVFSALVLGRLFLPNSGPLMTVGIAAMLVFFAYVLESVHSRRDGE